MVTIYTYVSDAFFRFLVRANNLMAFRGDVCVCLDLPFSLSEWHIASHTVYTNIGINEDYKTVPN